MEQDARRAIHRRSDIGRDTLDVLCRDGAGAIHKLTHLPPSCADGLRFSQQHRLAEIRILLKNVGRFDLDFLRAEAPARSVARFGVGGSL